MYESFHGRASEEVVEVEEQEHFHENLAALGVLVELRVETVTGLKRSLRFETGDGDGTRENPNIYGDQDGTWAVVYNYKPGQWGEYKRFKSKSKAQETIRLMNQARGSSYSYHLIEVPVGSPGFHFVGAKPNPIWPFGEGQPLGGRTTVLKMGKRARRAPVTKHVSVSMHKGYTVYQSGDAFTVPQLDRESRFDTKRDAQRFIDDEVKLRRNGKKGPIGSALDYGMDVAGAFGGGLDQKLGKAIGFKGNPNTYTDRAYGNEFQKRGKEWYQRLSFRSPGFKGLRADGGFDPWEKASTETVQMLVRMIKSGKVHKSNPEPISTLTTLLTSNESGTQLYFVGGDQSLDLDSLKFSEVEQEKELITIGECFFVSYLTQKDFDKFEQICYEHELGEVSGVLPTLIYDRLNKRLMLSGGEYHIERPMFETSPGIEN